MKKLLCAAAVVALLVTVLGVVCADDGTTTVGPHPRTKTLAGVIKTVANDADGKLASFVLATGAEDKAKDVTVKVDGNTRYKMVTDGPGERLPSGQNQVNTDASAAKVGLNVLCFFADTTKTGPAVTVRISPPQPSMGGTITTVTNNSAGKLASFVIKGGLGEYAKTLTVKVGIKTRYIILTSQPGQKPVWGQTENLTGASGVQVGRSADCFFGVADTAMANAATTVYLRIPHPGNTQQGGPGRN